MRLEGESVSPEIAIVQKYIVYSDAILRPNLAPMHIENDANGLAVHILTDNEITNLHTYNIAPKRAQVNL
jgi:hypothetical protein